LTDCAGKTERRIGRRDIWICYTTLAAAPTYSLVLHHNIYIYIRERERTVWRWWGGYERV